MLFNYGSVYDDGLFQLTFHNLQIVQKEFVVLLQLNYILIYS